MVAASYSDGLARYELRPVAGRVPSRRSGRGIPAPSWVLPSEVSAPLDALMRDTVRDLAGPLAPPLLRVIGAGGKKLRPALTLAVAAIGGRNADDPRVLRAAAAVELLHCATLVHDDLIDGAPLRRGVPTISGQEGRAAAVVGGDLLIAAASVLAGQVSGEAGAVIAQTLAALCRGEASQDDLRYDASAPVDQLIEVARLKTGSLLQAACLLGAQTGTADPGLRAAAADFGMNFGICVQLVDDLLDVVSSPALAAKPVGADFASGTLTLPIALALRDCPELGGLLTPGLDPVARERATDLLRDAAEALAATAATARAYGNDASQQLRSVAGDQAAARRLAGWPAAYLDSQLRSKVPEQHRWLLAPLTSAAP